MGLISWLRGTGWREVREEPMEHVPSPGPKEFRPVPKWTHPGRAGKDIFCPECAAKTHVFNFGWTALLCDSCRKMIGKYNWLMPVKKGRKNG
jgi:hypothetical protein